MIPISDSIKSRTFPFLNIFLILTTVSVFFLQLTTVDQEEFINQYALIPQIVNFANFSTLIPFVTSIFLHGGFLHIISNMLFLWVFGDNVEGHLGVLPYLVLYLASGITGGLLQYMLMPDSPIPMLGASGAIAGVLGSYFVMFPGSKIKTIVPFFGFITTAEIPAPFMLGYWFLLQVISGTFSLTVSADGGGIAFFAHIGGFVAGFILTMLFKPFIRFD